MKKRRETPHPTVFDLNASEFDRNATFTNWRPRGTQDWLLIYTAAGAGYLTTAKAEGATRIGEVTLYAPGEMQDYRTDPDTDRWNLLWAHFLPKPSWKPWLRWPTSPHGVKSLLLEKGEIRDGFAGAMKRTIHAIRRQLPNFRDFAANAFEEALLWAHVSASREPWTRMDPRVRQAMDYLVGHLREPFHFETLARHSGLSVSRLAHLFKEGTGASPQQFFEQQRMWHAGQLLRGSGLAIAEIADEVGYDDPFYFSNRFRRYAGKSPSAFRKEKHSG